MRRRSALTLLLALAAAAWAQGGEVPAAPLQPVGQGLASWYGEPFHGRRTASGEIFDKNALTAAHRSLAFGTVILVRNLDNGLEVTVRVNDRGPFVDGRILDLSEAAGRAIGLDRSGTARVAIYVVAAPAAARKRIQLGAYSSGANAQAAGRRAETAGFAVSYERSGAVTRVAVYVPAADLDEALARLRAAGFSSFQVSDEKK